MQFSGQSAVGFIPVCPSFPFLICQQRPSEKWTEKNRVMLTSIVMLGAITKFFIFFQNKLWQG